jgi:very-short-patch-repair endonuclease
MDGMRPKVANPTDWAIAQIAGRQHGVAVLTQLKAAGMSSRAVYRRVESGRLHRIHQGVYAVGHRALSSEGRWMAAVLACGEGAVLSHRSAAELWGLLPASRRWVDVTVPGDAGRVRRRGIRVHRSLTLVAGCITRERGIPVTTPARTMADLGRVARPDELRQARRQAEFVGMRLGDEAPSERTRSELERRFLRLCRRHRLPLPEVNVEIGGYTVDFLWRERRLIVETDGWQAHRGRAAFEDDRARDVQLRLLGFEVIRFTYRQVTKEPALVARTLRALLTAPATAG